MERWSRGWSGTLLLAALAGILPGLSLAAGPYGPEGGSQAQAGSPTLDVQRDRDKTVYTTGSTPRDNGRNDKDRAWEMLNNVIIDSRGAHGKRPDNNR